MSNRPLKIYLFYCSNSLSIDEVRRFSSERGYRLKTISLPCSGKVNILYLVKAFETGADGVILVTCRQGDCRYLEGNLRAKKRVEFVDALLEEVGLGRGRIVAIQAGEGEAGADQISGKIEDFCIKIMDLIKMTNSKAQIVK